MWMKWIVFDMMGVIFQVSDDVKNLLVPFIQRRNISVSSEKINELYRKASLGEIGSYDFWSQLGFGSDYPDIEKDYLDSYLKLDVEFLGIARSLKESYSLAVLSNDLKEWSSYLRGKFGLDKLFKVVVISGEVGYRKPNRKIYTILLDQIHESPSSCILIDDWTKNLCTASQLGMKTIKFLREDVTDDSSSDFQITSFSQLPGIVDRLFK